MQRLEVSGVVRLIYRSLGVKGLIPHIQRQMISTHNQAMLHNVESKHIVPWYAHWILWKSQSRKPLLYL